MKNEHNSKICNISICVIDILCTVFQMALNQTKKGDRMVKKINLLCSKSTWVDKKMDVLSLTGVDLNNKIFSYGDYHYGDIIYEEVTIGEIFDVIDSIQRQTVRNSASWLILQKVKDVLRKKFE